MFYATKHPLRAFSSVTHEPEPTCYTKAVTRPEWHAAIGHKFDALMENGTGHS